MISRVWNEACAGLLIIASSVTAETWRCLHSTTGWRSERQCVYNRWRATMSKKEQGCCLGIDTGASARLMAAWKRSRCRGNGVPSMWEGCVCVCIRNGLAPSKRKPNLTWCHQIGVYFPPKRPKGSGLGQAQLRGSAVKGSVFASHSPSSMAFPPGLVDSSSKIAASFPQITAVFMAREEKRKR